MKYVGFLILFTASVASFAFHNMATLPLYQRMVTLFQPSEDGSLQRRASYIRVAWESVKRDPFLGSGPGTFAYRYAESKYAPAFAENAMDYNRAAHNTYLEILVGQGVLGLTAFFWLLGMGLFYG
jgi:O-antigen ligase